jgi:hypothetical protein
MLEWREHRDGPRAFRFGVCGVTGMMLKVGLILIIVLAVLIGVPIGMVAWLGRETFRDVVIITWGALSIIAFLLVILVLLSLWSGVRGLIKDVKLTVREDVQPLLATGRETVNNVTGTSRFLSDTVVSPVLRLYGIISGVRRGFTVFTGITRRGKRAKV